MGTEPCGKAPVCIKPGLERILSPMIRGRPHREATGLYQPAFKQAIEQDEARPMLETPYVMRNSLNFSTGVGLGFRAEERHYYFVPNGFQHQLAAADEDSADEDAETSEAVGI